MGLDFSRIKGLFVNVFYQIHGKSTDSWDR